MPIWVLNLLATFESTGTMTSGFLFFIAALEALYFL